MLGVISVMGFIRCYKCLGFIGVIWIRDWGLHGLYELGVSDYSG